MRSKTATDLLKDNLDYIRRYHVFQMRYHKNYTSSDMEFYDIKMTSWIMILQIFFLTASSPDLTLAVLHITFFHHKWFSEDVIVEIQEDQPFAEADPVHVTAVALLIADRAVSEMTPLPEQIVLPLRREWELGLLKTGILPVYSRIFISGFFELDNSTSGLSSPYMNYDWGIHGYLEPQKDKFI